MVFLNRFYWPDVAATAQMLTDLAEDLARDGWEITVVASRTGYAERGAQLPAEEVRNGVKILRVATTRFGRDRLWGRAGDYATYLWGAWRHLLTLPTPDVVVAMTDPPLVAGPVVMAARLRGFRTAYWVQDLYPHLAAKLGLVREGSIPYRIADSVARWIHGSCDAVITLGPRMSETLIGAGAHIERVAHVHNWADAGAICPVAPEKNSFLREQRLEGRFVVLYSGNAGRAHTFDAVMEAARRLRHEPEVVFLFIGGGKLLPEIRAVVEREELGNVRFLDYMPREQLSESLSAAGVSLVTESPAVVGLLVPSKTYGILASGRPILFVGSDRSDVAAVVAESECGIVISPDDPASLVAAIRHLRDHPREAAEMGERARQAAITTYDRQHATRRWAEAVEALCLRVPRERAPHAR